MRYLLFPIALLFATPVFGQAYRWVDADGVVHYSDRPHPGAETIELEGVGRLGTSRGDSAPPPARPAETPPGGAAVEQRPGDTAAQSAPRAGGYTSLEIVRPLQGETLWNIGSKLAVSLRMSPPLADGDRIRLLLDGRKLTDLPTGELDITIDEVYRGQHTLQAEIESSRGETLTQSPIKTFYVQQTTIRN